MHAIAPGKVILSGEHAVVYGAPALAVAAECHIHAHFTPHSADAVSLSGSLLDSQYSLSELDVLKAQLDSRFDAFSAGTLAVDSLLESPDQLIAYVLASQQLCVGGRLRVESDLPTGAGMGSSAAAISAVLIVANTLMQQHGVAPLNPEQRFSLTRYCERLQHGRGSAIDAAAVTFGGLVRVESDQATPLGSVLGEGWYRVNTGSPSVSTGHCVQQVRSQFAQSSIWAEFRQVTENLQAALGHPDRVHAAVRANHRLLQEIGVVPEPVAQFITAAQHSGASAKISGAGAVAGDCGGQVLLYAPGVDVSSVCAEFNYPCYPLQEDSQGARLLCD